MAGGRLRPENLHALFQGKRLLVNALAPERVVNLYDRDDPGQERYVLFFEPPGIAGPVQFLVVAGDQRGDVFERAELEADLRPERRMGLHDREFFRRERAGLLENLWRDGHFAGVVKEGAAVKLPHLGFRKAQPLAE